ncbi:MAG: decaprenyl-phosphate phosphoribosyltransferase [Capsulimonadaceae bacterium]|nr:decaprenyl-phosphate phosphoribosyltransferase [Capsulimonadaceae bacterium]
MATTEQETLGNPMSSPTKRRRSGPVALLVAMRPKQWTKNLLVFAGLLFTIDAHHGATDFLRACFGFIAFSLLSSSTYLINDVLDVETDRNHPKKQFRPIAAGELSPSAAIIAALLMTVGMLAFSFHLDFKFGLCTVAYMVLTTAYTFKLKHVVILDLLVLASGFVLRAIGGARVIPVQISPWLVLCTLLLALFLAISKRRGELVAVSQGRRHARPILSEYTAAMLDQMNTIVTSALMMSYALYTIQSDTAHHHNYLMASIPFVIYGIFRYLYLIHRHEKGETPDEILLQDRPLLISILLWGLTTGIVILHPWSR